MPALARMFVVAIAALAMPLGAFAQTYPAKPVRIVAPFAAGGLADVLARALAERLTAQIGGPFIVENRTGAGGNIGADAVAKAEPDGYTLLLTSTGILTINQFLYAKMPFDAETAFAPITVIADMPMLLLVRADGPAKSVNDLVALSKREPDRVFFGSPGNGTTGHLGMELFKAATGTRIAHVPYKSAAEAVTAAVSGQTLGMFDNPPTVMSQIKAGKLLALGVAAKERMPLLPDVPTISEAGVPNFEASSWFGLVAPAKTPQAVIARLHAETVKALAAPEMQSRFNALGARLVGNSPDQFAQFIVAERAKWGGLIRSANIRIE